MNLVRLGHYHTPTGPDDSGFCQTALVVHVEVDVVSTVTVNLAIWNHDGGSEVRRDVAVATPAADFATFHLSGDCPWKR